MDKVKGPSTEQLKAQRQSFESPNGPAPEGPGELYTIVAGDTLSKIAQRKLGDVEAWTRIAAENPQIKDPDRVWPGDQIRLPVAEQTRPLSAQQVERKTGQADASQVVAKFASEHDASAQAVAKKDGLLNFMSQKPLGPEEIERQIKQADERAQTPRRPKSGDLTDQQSFNRWLYEDSNLIQKQRPPIEQRPPVEEPPPKNKRPPEKSKPPRVKKPPEERPPRVERPPVEERPPRVERPPVEERPPRVERPPVEERPPNVGRPPTEERPPNVGRPPAEERPPNVGRPPTEERPPNVGRPPAEERPPNVGRPPAEERPPHVGRPPAEETPPNVGRPPAEETPPNVGRPPEERPPIGEPDGPTRRPPVNIIPPPGEETIGELDNVTKSFGAVLRRFGYNVAEPPPAVGEDAAEAFEGALYNYFMYAEEHAPEELDAMLRLLVRPDATTNEPGRGPTVYDGYTPSAEAAPETSVDPWAGWEASPGLHGNNVPWYESDPGPVYVPGNTRPVTRSDRNPVRTPISRPVSRPVVNPVGDNPYRVGRPGGSVGRPGGSVGRPGGSVGRPSGRLNTPVYRPANNPVSRPVYNGGRVGSSVGRPSTNVGRPSGSVGRPVNPRTRGPGN